MRGAEPRRGQRGGRAHREERDHDRGGTHRHHADTRLHHQDGVRGGQGQKYLDLSKIIFECNIRQQEHEKYFLHENI